MSTAADNEDPEAPIEGAGESSAAASVELASLAAGLMVRAAKGDGAISSAETHRMLEILGDSLGLRSAEAMEHLTAAVSRLSDGEEAEQELLQRAAGLSAADKASAFAMMLSIVGVDGRIEPGEHRAVVSAGKMLDLSVETIYAELEALKATP